MAFRDFIKPRLQDWMMGFMDEMRPETVGRAEGEVLEVGFGTGRNLRLYPSAVKSVTGLDPLVTDGVAAVDARVAAAPFPVTRLPTDQVAGRDRARMSARSCRAIRVQIRPAKLVSNDPPWYNPERWLLPMIRSTTIRRLPVL